MNEFLGIARAERSQRLFKHRDPWRIRCSRQVQNMKTDEKPSVSTLLDLLEGQDQKCAYSGIPLTPESAVVDHIIPYSKGGTDKIENLQWLHRDVNAMKGSFTEDDFLFWVKKVSEYCLATSS